MHYLTQVALFITLLWSGQTQTVVFNVPTATTTPVIIHAVKDVVMGVCKSTDCGRSNALTERNGSILDMSVQEGLIPSHPATTTSSTTVTEVTPNPDSSGSYASMSAETPGEYVPLATLCYSQGNCKAQTPINSTYHY